MPGDLVISDAAVSTAPKDTRVPASSRYIVKQVQALYTDNGAGGAWLPALEIVSDAGIVTGRYVGESVAAGDGQEVTWFPLGSKGSGGSAGTLGLPNAVWAAPETFPPQNVPSGAERQITLSDGTFSTTDDTIFYNVGSVIRITAPGLYLALMHIVNDATGPIIDDTALYFRWARSHGGNEQIVPRDTARSDSGGTIASPNGDGTTDWVECISWAYVSDTTATGVSLTAWYFNHDPNPLGINIGDRLVTVVQLQPISAATLATFGSFP